MDEVAESLHGIAKRSVISRESPYNEEFKYKVRDRGVRRDSFLTFSITLTLASRLEIHLTLRARHDHFIHEHRDHLRYVKDIRSLAIADEPTVSH